MHVEDVRREESALAIALTPCEVNDSSHRTNPPSARMFGCDLGHAHFGRTSTRRSLSGFVRREPDVSAEPGQPARRNWSAGEVRPFVLTPDAYPRICGSYLRRPSFRGARSRPACNLPRLADRFARFMMTELRRLARFAPV